MAESDQRPVTINISRTRGDTFPFVVTITDAAGDAINISGYSFLLSVDLVADPGDDSGQLFQLTGTLLDGGVNGQVEFEPSALQADQNPETYYHDIQMTDGSSKIRTIAKGTYVIDQDITKD